MKILLVDVETAPLRVYAWSLWEDDLNTNSIEEPGYTLCWSAKFLGEKKIHFGSVRKDGRKRMLKRIHSLMHKADALVHYNGAKFDIPVLQGEFLKEKMKPPAPSASIDVYRAVRGKFRFPSNSMNWVARELGLGQKTKHKGMDLWKGCMAGDPTSWRVMEKYNKQDVRLLERVYNRVLPWIDNHPNHGMYSHPENPVCPNCRSTNVQKNGVTRKLSGLYGRYKCNDCGKWSQTQTVVEKKKVFLK